MSELLEVRTNGTVLSGKYYDISSALSPGDLLTQNTAKGIPNSIHGLEN